MALRPNPYLPEDPRFRAEENRLLHEDKLERAAEEHNRLLQQQGLDARVRSEERIQAEALQTPITLGSVAMLAVLGLAGIFLIGGVTCYRSIKYGDIKEREYVANTAQRYLIAGLQAGGTSNVDMGGIKNVEIDEGWSLWTIKGTFIDNSGNTLTGFSLTVKENEGEDAAKEPYSVQEVAFDRSIPWKIPYTIESLEPWNVRAQRENESRARERVKHDARDEALARLKAADMRRFMLDRGFDPEHIPMSETYEQEQARYETRRQLNREFESDWRDRWVRKDPSTRPSAS